MDYIPPDQAVPPLPVLLSLPSTLSATTIAPPVRSDPVIALKATTASDLTSPPVNRFPQQTPLAPNPYPIVIPPSGLPNIVVVVVPKMAG